MCWSNNCLKPTSQPFCSVGSKKEDKKWPIESSSRSKRRLVTCSDRSLMLHNTFRCNLERKGKSLKTKNDECESVLFIHIQSCREWVDVAWTNKVGGFSWITIWKQVEGYKRVAHLGRIHCIGCRDQSPLSWPLYWPQWLFSAPRPTWPTREGGRQWQTKELCSCRFSQKLFVSNFLFYGRSIADKRALQLQVFTKKKILQALADKGSSQSRLFRDKLYVFFLSPAPFLDHEESGWFHGRAVGVMLGWRLLSTAGDLNPIWWMQNHQPLLNNWAEEVEANVGEFRIGPSSLMLGWRLLSTAGQRWQLTSIQFGECKTTNPS